MRFLHHGWLTVLVGLGTALAAPGDELATRARAILETHCYRCHGQDGVVKGGFGHVLDRDRLVARGQLVPGKPDDSELYARITRGEMPPPGKGSRPTADDTALLRRWIEAGAPAVPRSDRPRRFLTEADVQRLVLADLQQLPQRQRRFMRYLSLANLAAAGDAEVQQTRRALARLVNSLSWHPRVTVPEPIDADALLYRLDLRDYQWTARSWERLQLANPYRLDTTSTDGLVLRGDWFVATASRPPLYHDVLQLPGSDRELERLLRVDVLANYQEERVVRSGFNDSGVSRNNRLIERHDAAYGAYWRSFDFADNTERQNLFAHPLGPLPGPASFRAAGGEVIFHLPNGLLGFLLVDANGRRIERAPVEIVSDPGRPDRTVETGLSCMSCHSRGFIPKADQVRAHVVRHSATFSPEEREAVEGLYAPESVQRRLLREDNERYLKSVARLGALPDAEDAINAVARRYEAPLDLAAAAAELGLTTEALRPWVDGSAERRRLLGPLLVAGGTVQRSAFQAAFAELARSLPPVTTTVVKEARPFTGHTAAVNALAVSRDGHLLLSASDDRSVRVWDADSGRERLLLVGHADRVITVAVAPNGRHAASGGADRRVLLWDLADGRLLQQLDGHADRVLALAYSPDGTRLASTSSDRTIRLWDTERGALVRTITLHAESGTLAFSRDGRHLLAGCRDGTVSLCDVTNGEEVRRFTGHTRTVHAVAFSPDAKTVLSGGGDGIVRLWDTATGREVSQLERQRGTVVAIAVSADGRRALVATSRYRDTLPPIRLWQLDSGVELRSYPGRAGEAVYSIAFGPDGERAFSAAANHALRLWDVSAR